MSYYLAPSLVALRDEVDGRWPHRDKGADGWIGDASHAARVSDHNPDAKGCVHAIDVDTDGINPRELVAALVGDSRVWYVIYDRTIYSRTYDWHARAYTGSDPHTGHVHVSIRYDVRSETLRSPWLTGHKQRTRGHRPMSVSTVNAALRGERVGPHGHRMVRRLQHAIADEVGIRVEADGIAGVRTERAVRHLEREWHYATPDGRVGAPLLRRLGEGRRWRVRT